MATLTQRVAKLEKTVNGEAPEVEPPNLLYTAFVNQFVEINRKLTNIGAQVNLIDSARRVSGQVRSVDTDLWGYVSPSGRKIEVTLDYKQVMETFLESSASKYKTLYKKEYNLYKKLLGL